MAQTISPKLQPAAVQWNRMNLPTSCCAVSFAHQILSAAALLLDIYHSSVLYGARLAQAYGRRAAGARRARGTMPDAVVGLWRS